MRRAAIGLIAAAALMAGCRSAATPPAALPAPGFATVLDTLVPRALARTGTPGAAVAAVEGGRIVLARGYGLADVADSVAFTADTRINVASVSKAVTAWGVLRLVESEAIGLDDPVDRRLSRWTVPADSFDPAGVTVRRLLDHTSGLGMPSVPWFPADGTIPSLEDVLAGRAGGAGVRLERSPGGEWSYSGGGYTLLQLFVEEVAGEPFEEYMERRVLRPIGMRATTYGPRAGDAVGYDEAGASVPPVRFVGAAAAGLTTTAADFARLLVAYHRAWTGRPGVLGAAALRAVAAAPVPVTLEGAEGAFYGLGHGVHRRRDGSVLLYHTGGNPGFKAWFLVDPESGDGVFVAVNSDAGVPVITAVRDAWGAAHGDDLPPLY